MGTSNVARKQRHASQGLEGVNTRPLTRSTAKSMKGVEESPAPLPLLLILPSAPSLLR